jgi:caa(3)-type oxidase subunit IV
MAAAPQAKAMPIFWHFMYLREERGLVRLFAIDGSAWLLVLLLLLTADYATR